ncbi:hypothetical protein [Paraburkholderia aromaticivorans]
MRGPFEDDDPAPTPRKKRFSGELARLCGVHAGAQPRRPMQTAALAIAKA